MASRIDLDKLVAGCADDATDDGIRIDTVLEPLTGPGGMVKPAVYAGGKYQRDRRWLDPDDKKPTKVIVIDNVPSQANRLEDALRRHRREIPIPEFVLDLSEIPQLPIHLPRELSSLKFPHRNADAYLRDSALNGVDFLKTDLGKSIFGASAQSCGPLIAWFPQSLLYGFWQAHLGKKRQNTKHARAWVSEILGWQPASTSTSTMGVKGDELNLNTDDIISSKPDDRTEWEIGDAVSVQDGKKDRLSEIGHGQIIFPKDGDTLAAPVSFARITQHATLSFSQLRRISLGSDASRSADTATRALLVALALHAHQLAFRHGFALRSRAELRPKHTSSTWLSGNGDSPIELGDVDATASLLSEALKHAAELDVPLDGWVAESVRLTPKGNLARAIRSTWPELD